MGTSAEAVVVRSALRAVASAQSAPVESPTAAPAQGEEHEGRSRGLLARAGALCALVMVLVAALVWVGTRPGASQSCEPIAYRFEGDPPELVRREAERALQELHVRSGLTFAAVRGPVAAGEPAELRIVWTAHPRQPLSSGAAENRAGRVLAYGEGRWLARPNRSLRLVSGVVELDATAAWVPGIDRGDRLAGVIVHELGHVAGLGHSADPASFMYSIAAANPRHWTADDLDQLAVVGRNAGCRRAR